MKKILLIVGSPRGRRSNSRRIARAFLDGMNANEAYEIDEFIIAEHNIKPCTGCFYCWRNEEGKCMLQDDMDELMEKYMTSDYVAWAFPDYCYGIPATTKMVMDRMLAVVYPEQYEGPGSSTMHVRRYDFSRQKFLLFVTCGFYHVEHNLDAIDKQFELIYGTNYDKVFCPAGELFSTDFMRKYTAPYIQTLHEAGQEYAQTGEISAPMQKRLDTPIIDRATYVAFVNDDLLWRKKGETDAEYRLRRAGALIHSMSYTYSPEKLEAEQGVLEIEMTDTGYACQLLLDKTGCKICEIRENYLPYHLKIVAPRKFFLPRQTLEQSVETQTKKDLVDFDALIDMLNRCVKRGRSSTLRFQ